MNKLMLVGFAVMAAIVSLAGVPTGNLPIPTGGLVVHLDASDLASMTCDDKNRVIEWRSQVGAVKLVQGAAQAVDTLPYYQSSISFPTGADIPGVVVGFETGYVYSNVGTTDNAHCTSTYLQSDTAIDARETFIVMVSLDSGAKGKATPYDGIWFDFGTESDQLRYAGNMWGPDTVYSYSGSTWFYNGNDGRAWINGTLVYDYPTLFEQCGNVGGWASSSSRGFGKQVTVIDAIGGSIREHVGKPMIGYNSTRCGPAVFCEVAIYSHILSDVDRMYVQKALYDKWIGKMTYVQWTGKAGDDRWSTAMNWSGEVVPTTTDTVAIGGAAVTVDCDAVCGMLAAPGATLTVDKDATFALEAFLGSNDGLMLTGLGALKFKENSTTAIPPTVTISGGLTARLGGPATAMDLQGGDQSFRSVLGGGKVVNTAETAAMLTLAGTADGKLEAVIGDRINVHKAGAETTLEVAGCQNYTGDTILDGGAVRAVTNLLVDAMQGLVLHLDASRADTLMRDADNKVDRWYLTNTNLYFVLATTNEKMSDKYKSMFDRPLYLPMGVNGKMPCVRFSQDLNRQYIITVNPQGEQEVQRQAMKLGEDRGEDVLTARHRTAFVVHIPKITSADNIVPYGRYYLGDVGNRYHALVRYDSNSNKCYRDSVWGGGTNEVYVNAKKSYDFLGGQTGSFPFGDSAVPGSLYPHILTVTIPECDPEPPVLDYRPVIGCYVFRSFNDNGGMECKTYVGDICEIIVFDRYLQDAERRMVETYLYEKWFNAAFAPAQHSICGELSFSNTLSSASTYVVKSNTTVVPTGNQVFSALIIDAQDSTTVPCLTFAGDFDAAKSSITFAGCEKIEKGAVVKTAGLLTGEFAKVTGVGKDQRVRYTLKEVVLRMIRGLGIFIR